MLRVEEYYFSLSKEESGGITPTGTKIIITNGTHDVTNYAQANVNVIADNTALFNEYNTKEWGTSGGAN